MQTASVGLSHYGELRGVEQFIEATAAQYLNLCLDFIATLPGCYRPTVNEGIRSVARMELLYDRYLHHGGALAAVPPNSTHGPAIGNAVDLGGPNGEALSPLVLAALHAYGPRYGVLATGLSFSRPESWHFNVYPWRATGPLIDVRADAAKAAAEKAAAAAEAKRLAEEAARAEAARILRIKKGISVLWIRSKKSGVWYLIDGHDVQQIDSMKDAQRVSRMVGFRSTAVTSADASFAIEIARDRARSLGKSLGLPAIEKKLDALLAKEVKGADPSDSVEVEVV
jgi:hypothetical protein